MQFLAVTGRGLVGTRILLIVPWGLGLPGAYLAAAATGGGAETLLQGYTAAWLLVRRERLEAPVYGYVGGGLKGGGYEGGGYIGAVS